MSFIISRQRWAHPPRISVAPGSSPVSLMPAFSWTGPAAPHAHLIAGLDAICRHACQRRSWSRQPAWRRYSGVNPPPSAPASTKCLLTAPSVWTQSDACTVPPVASDPEKSVLWLCVGSRRRDPRSPSLMSAAMPSSMAASPTSHLPNGTSQFARMRSTSPQLERCPLTSWWRSGT
jgi:hypothetical protein